MCLFKFWDADLTCNTQKRLKWTINGFKLLNLFLHSNTNINKKASLLLGSTILKAQLYRIQSLRMLCELNLNKLEIIFFKVMVVMVGNT